MGITRRQFVNGLMGLGTGAVLSKVPSDQHERGLDCRPTELLSDFRRLPPFPRDFLWGASTAAHQVEGGNPLKGSDWERMSGVPPYPANAPDFAHLNDDGSFGGRFPAYLHAANQMHHNAVRISLNWNLIEPEQGVFNPKAIEMYRAILRNCVENGLTPFVTLYHYALPLWAADKGGWVTPSGTDPHDAPMAKAFGNFAGAMASELGPLVGHWLTINEPAGAAGGGYIDGSKPPGKTLQLGNALKAMEGMGYGHAAAYRAIKNVDPRAQVGIAQGMRYFIPHDPGSSADRSAAKQMHYWVNAASLDAAAVGTVDWNMDGRMDVHEDPALIGLDFVGMQYYSRSAISGLWDIPGVLGLPLKGLPSDDSPPIRSILGGPEDPTSMGWEVYPQGLYDLLQWAWNRYDLPIVITENGIPDSGQPDFRRTQYIADHVYKAQEALADGVDLRGYLHWSLMDNWEWMWGTAQRFGLLRVDYGDGSFAPTLGAQTLTEIIQNNGTSPSLMEATRDPTAAARRARCQ